MLLTDAAGALGRFSFAGRCPPSARSAQCAARAAGRWSAAGQCSLAAWPPGPAPPAAAGQLRAGRLWHGVPPSARRPGAPLATARLCVEVLAGGGQVGPGLYRCQHSGAVQPLLDAHDLRTGPGHHGGVVAAAGACGGGRRGGWPAHARVARWQRLFAPRERRRRPPSQLDTAQAHAHTSSAFPGCCKPPCSPAHAAQATRSVLSPLCLSQQAAGRAHAGRMR